LNLTGRPQRILGIGLMLVMAAVAVMGYSSIRRDVQNLKEISQDNILWTATQMEVELLRFKLSLARLAIDHTPEALDEARERFDILWSRVFLMGAGRVGDLIASYDQGHGSIPAFQQYLREIDPVFATLRPDDLPAMRTLLRELDAFQDDLRLYTLRVVRGDTAAAAQVRDRIQLSSQLTMAVSLAAMLLSAFGLVLLLNDNRRQRQLARLNQRIAEEAELSSRAKSRFLTMMSHELRNPLNGVLGPLALLGQSDLPLRHQRLVEQAQISGRSIVQMLAGLLDYGEMQDGRFRLRDEPLRLSALIKAISSDLASGGPRRALVILDPAAPEIVHGDAERLRHIYVHLCEYVLDGIESEAVALTLSHDGTNLTGEIAFGSGAALDWKLDLMMGLNEIAPDQVNREALRPLIARGLIAAAHGVLTLEDGQGGGRAIRVSVPAPPHQVERLRVRLQSRSAALSALYQAALRSDRIVFVRPDDAAPVDLVLLDAGSSETPPLDLLRRRNPGALIVALGTPQEPGSFDEVLETPADAGALRARILGKLA
jgi:signal transduction histidine kinase